MSPSSVSRDPLGDGHAPWSEQLTAPLDSAPSEPTRPLPRTDDAAPGRTGVASGKLHRLDPDTGVLEPVGDGHLTPAAQRVTATAAWDTIRPAVASGATSAEAPAESGESVAARQKARFGGMQVLPGLFGWLTALSVGGLLLWVARLAGLQWGLDTSHGIGGALDQGLAAPQEPVSWIALAVLVLVESLAFLAGGYVAGRMARFSGVTHGVAVWLWSLVGRVTATAVVFLGLATLGSEPSALAVQSSLGSIVGWGLVALAGMTLVDLLAAMAGSVWGTRFHRRVDAWTAGAAGSR